MKTRIGFVANSSTSSFILIASKEHVDMVQAEMTIFAKEYVNHVRTQDCKFLGKDVVIFSGMTGDCSSWCNFKFDNFPVTDEQRENYWEIWPNFVDRLTEVAGKENVIYDSSE